MGFLSPKFTSNFCVTLLVLDVSAFCLLLLVPGLKALVSIISDFLSALAFCEPANTI